MAVFLLNTCKFNGCGITFNTLPELIFHIEDTHLDSEPRNIEETEFKQTSCLPVSYIFRVFSGDCKGSAGLQKVLAANGVTARSVRKESNGSEMEEENYESDSEKSSVDSWSNNSVEGEANSASNTATTKKAPPPAVPEDQERTYVCSYTNCRKRYRNNNGLRYHIRSVHANQLPKKDSSVTKVYKCFCDKIYKTSYGLKNHMKVCAVCVGQPFNLDDHLIEVSNSVEAPSSNTTTITTSTNGSTDLSTTVSINGLGTFTSPAVSTDAGSIVLSAATTNGSAHSNGHSNAHVNNRPVSQMNGYLNSSLSAGVSTGNFAPSSVSTLGNSVGILKSELTNSINVSTINSNASAMTNSSQNHVVNATPIVVTSSANGSINGHSYQATPVVSTVTNGNTISITNTSNLNSMVKPQSEIVSTAVAQVAEQVVIDTTHTYSLPDPSSVKKEPRSPIRSDKIAVSIHQMPATA